MPAKKAAHQLRLAGRRREHREAKARAFHRSSSWRLHAPPTRPLHQVPPILPILVILRTPCQIYRIQFCDIDPSQCMSAKIAQKVRSHAWPVDISAPGSLHLCT